MPKKLYVDQISPGGGLAMTMHSLSVSYNHTILGRHGKPDLSPIFRAGKYVCIIMAGPNGSATMSFIDVCADPGFALAFANDPEHPAYVRKGLIEMMDWIKVNADSVTDEYEFVKGLAPALPLNIDN